MVRVPSGLVAPLSVYDRPLGSGLQVLGRICRVAPPSSAAGLGAVRRSRRVFCSFWLLIAPRAGRRKSPIVPAAAQSGRAVPPIPGALYRPFRLALRSSRYPCGHDFNAELEVASGPPFRLR